MHSIENNNYSTTKVYRADIDGLRAIAVLFVVFYHAFPLYLKGGFVGVDVFFVISGYLITSIIIEGLEQGGFNFTEFYIRRIKRIFPALLVVLTTCLMFGWWALLADEYSQLGKHIAGSAGFISNFILLNESGYFNNEVETKPLLHIWSVGIEEQFYIIWPLLLWFFWRLKKNLLLLVSTLLVVSFILNINSASIDAASAFYSPQTRFWELMAGSVLVCIKYSKVSNLNLFNSGEVSLWKNVVFFRTISIGRKKLCSLQSILGITVLVVSVVIIAKDKVFPGWWVILPVLGTVLIISAGKGAWFNREVLSMRLLVWFGLISFPLYLWHWVLLSFSRIIESETPAYTTRIILVIISIFLAWLTYKFIEKPIRYGNFTKIKLGVLLLLMVVIGSSGYTIYRNDGLAFRTHIKYAKKVNDEFIGWNWKYTVNELCLNEYPLKGIEDYGSWFCVQSKNKKPTILLLGNSYANQYYVGFTKNKNFQHHSVLSIGSCGPEWVEKSDIVKALKTKFSGYTSESAKNGSPCSGFRPLEQLNHINNIIKKSNSVRIALLIWPGKTYSDKYISLLKKRIDFLEGNHVKVVIFIPHIKLGYDIKGCFARPFKKPNKNCKFNYLDYKKELLDFEPIIEKILSTNPETLFFNPNNLFCDLNECSFIRNEMPLLRDTSFHISEYGSIELSKIFEVWAKINLPEIFK